APDGVLPTCGELIGRAARRAIPVSEIRDEVHRQVAAFELEMGFAPDHIDGHQHVHALPVVRGAVLDALAERVKVAARKPLLRDPAETLA
ncbi:ChbG/HpnK family deacetylase, partial [Shewanella algae]|uniref:ChbG/HpnK family deacetylase n=1 Tax=Shewanella algae TaxID=38313 RepID=UPI00313E2230